MALKVWVVLLLLLQGNFILCQGNGDASGGILDLDLRSLVLYPYGNEQYELIFSSKGGTSPYFYQFSALPNGWKSQGSALIFPKSIFDGSQPIRVVVKVRDSKGQFIQKSVTLNFSGQIPQSSTTNIRRQTADQIAIQQNSVLATVQDPSIQFSSGSFTAQIPLEQQTLPELKDNLALLQDTLSLQKKQQNICQSNIRQAQTNKTAIQLQISSKQTSLRAAMTRLEQSKTELDSSLLKRLQLNRELQTAQQPTSVSSISLIQTQTKLENCRKDNEAASKTINTSIVKQASIDAQIKSKQDAVFESKKKILSLNIDLQLVQTNLSRIRKQLLEAQGQELRIQSEISRESKIPATLELQIQQLQKQKVQVQATITRTNAVTLDCSLYEKQLQSLRALANGVTPRSAAITTQLNALQKKIAQLNATSDTLRIQINNLSADISNLNTRLQSIQTQINNYSSQCVIFLENVANLEENIKNVTQQISKLEIQQGIATPVLDNRANQTIQNNQNTTAKTTDNNTTQTLEDLLKEVEKLVGPRTTDNNTGSIVTNNNVTTTNQTNTTINTNQPARFSVFDTLAQAESGAIPTTPQSQASQQITQQPIQQTTTQQPTQQPTQQTTQQQSIPSQIVENYVPIFPVDPTLQQGINATTQSQTSTGGTIRTNATTGANSSQNQSSQINFSVNNQIKQINTNNSQSSATGTQSQTTQQGAIDSTTQTAQTAINNGNQQFMLSSAVANILAGKKVDFTQIDIPNPTNVPNQITQTSIPMSSNEPGAALNLKQSP